MDISIIIPFHSNFSWLRVCLDSLLKYVEDSIEIIIVVNNKDITEIPDFIRSRRFKIIHIKNDLGYSKAVNVGANEAKGQYLVFLDSDTCVSENWLHNLYLLYTSNKDIGFVASKLINPFSSRVIDFGMALSRFNNAHPYLDRISNSRLVSNNKRVQMACSASFMIEKKLFLTMGGMDEELIHFYQDTDFCLRLKDYDKECWVCSDSVAYHKGNTCSVNRNPFRGDVKALYSGKNFHRMEYDLSGYIKESHDYFTTDTISSGAYLLLDLSAVADREWFIDEYRQYFDIISVYSFPYNEKDSEHIDLINHAGYTSMCQNINIIYFVDRFISLKNNSLWWKYREKYKDIIVDRNANIVTVESLRNDTV